MSYIEDHYDLESKVGDQSLQRVDAQLGTKPRQSLQTRKLENLKRNACRKRNPVELLCHESRDMRESKN